MTPLVKCSSCQGSGKRKLTKKLSWCLRLLEKHGPCTPRELYDKATKDCHISYFNHMLRRLEEFGLAEEQEDGRFKVSASSPA